MWLRLACWLAVHCRWAERAGIRLVYWWTWLRFHRVKDDDVEQALRRMYDGIGRDSQVEIENARDALYVTTNHCHLRSLCHRYGDVEAVRVFCEGDRLYWRRRYGHWYSKRTGEQCVARWCVTHGRVKYD